MSLTASNDFDSFKLKEFEREADEPWTTVPGSGIPADASVCSRNHGRWRKSAEEQIKGLWRENKVT